MKEFRKVSTNLKYIGSRLLLIFIFTICGFGQIPSSEIQSIELGKSIEREISNPETHTYKINVPIGNYLVVKVDQKVDVLVTVLDWTGKKIQEVDNPYGIQLAEIIRLISDKSADYLFEIKILEPKTKSGSYKIEIETLRIATDEDKLRIVAESYFSEANLAYAKGTAESYKTTIEKLDLSLPLFRQLGDQKREHYVIDRLGRVYNQIGDKKKSQEYHFQALELARKMNDKIFIARSLDALGVTYYTQGESRKAIEYWVEVLEMYKERGDQSLITATLNNIGAAYNNLGEYAKSLDYMNQVLEPARQRGDRLLESAVLRNIGVSHLNLGDDLKCLEYLAQSLVIAKEIKNRRQEATVLNSFGSTYSGMGDEQKAIDFYTQALAIQKETGNKFGEIATLNSLGYSYYKLKQYQTALDFLNQGVELNKSLNLRNLESTLQYQTGLVYAALKEYEKARPYFLKARESFAFMESNLQKHRANYMLAQIDKEEGKLDESQAKILPIIDFFEASRKQFIQPDQRSTYFSTAQNVYSFYIELLMAKYQKNGDKNIAAEAFQISERTRARSLIEILSQAKIDFRKNADPELLQREKILQQQISESSSRLTRLLSGKFTDEQKTATVTELENFRAEYQEIQAKTLVGNKRYAELIMPSPLNLKDIQTQVVDEETTLLEYSLGKDKSFVFVITRDSFEAIELPKREEIDAKARQVYELLTARNKAVKFETSDEKRLRIAKADEDFPAAAAELSQLILSPIKNNLTKKRLLIVADGALNYVPFAVLPNPRSQTPNPQPSSPLIVSHEIVMLPSASTLAVIRKELDGRQPAPKTVAVLADPVFNTNDERFKILTANRKNTPQIEKASFSKTRSANVYETNDLTRTVKDFSDENNEFAFSRLPFTRKEAEAIASFAPNSQKKLALDFSASRASTLSADLAQYRIIHFATHSFINNKHPELSGIILSLIDENGSAQNGFLRSDEIFNLKLPAELVVLSGCRTGFGKEIRGEGLMGLTRGFMYAGAKRVAVSLWDVNDEATSILMAIFYREMLGNNKLSPASALRQAQISMIKDKKWNNPYYWSTFILQGEPR